jgi:hypothetical protein
MPHSSYDQPRKHELIKGLFFRKQWRNQRLANGQLPNEFGDLPIIIFISKFLPIEILLFLAVSINYRELKVIVDLQ